MKRLGVQKTEKVCPPKPVYENGRSSFISFSVREELVGSRGWIARLDSRASAKKWCLESGKQSTNLVLGIQKNSILLCITRSSLGENRRIERGSLRGWSKMFKIVEQVKGDLF